MTVCSPVMADVPEADDQTAPAVELDRLRRTWDAGLVETLERLDHLVAQTEQALRLTRILVAVWRPAPG